MRKITRCPSRPRTSQPRLFVEAPAASQSDQVIDAPFSDQPAADQNEDATAVDAAGCGAGCFDEDVLETATMEEDGEEERRRVCVQALAKTAQ
eukprot:5959743-Amphidinium_carterae.1